MGVPSHSLVGCLNLAELAWRYRRQGRLRTGSLDCNNTGPVHIAAVGGR